MATEKEKTAPFVKKFNGIEKLSSEEFLLVFRKYDKDGKSSISLMNSAPPRNVSGGWGEVRPTGYGRYRLFP